MRAPLLLLSLVACGGLPEVTVSVTPEAPTVEDTLNAVVQDGDTVLSSDQVSLTWTVDGEPAGADAQLSLAPFAKGQVVEVTASAVDGDRAGEPGSVSVTINNAPPVVNNASILPARASSADSLTVEAFTRDADGDPVSVEVTWFVDGTEVATGPELADGFTRGASVEAEVVPDDGEDTGAPYRTDAITIDNGPPPPPSPTLIVAREWVPSALRCTVDELPVDPDGDDVDVELRWVVDGTPRGAEVRSDRTLQIGSDETAIGGEWGCEARTLDSEGGASEWVAAGTVTDQTCDRQTVTLTGSHSASLAYNNGTRWNDTTLRAYTFGVPDGNDDIVGWIAFDLGPLADVGGVLDATLDLHVSGWTGGPEIVVVQTSARTWDPSTITPETLPRSGAISAPKLDATPGERTRFALDLDAWTHGPAPGVTVTTIGVDNLTGTFSYGYFGSVNSTAFQPELELTVCR